MNWSDLQAMLNRHAIRLSLEDKVVIKSAEPVPAKVLALLKDNAVLVKDELRQQASQSAVLPEDLKAFLLRVANQGAGLSGAVLLPGGMVTNIDEYVLATATTYLVRPGPDLLRLLQEAHSACPTTAP